ncbi:MAG: cation transporter [Nitrospirae bacterium CG18_big_fil_WC_8_21_14_2_50_70_55]|nr:CDF family Co(II)/Ni(II) efflux transporter DmeF [Deltaproteobacteria bacterium]PIQ06316.1 MAG: cation transporter [Nitrospirae bacterium CG18_big_fil_WC_8_21_14_2_50_70_55]PIU77605.1 MAG: cation transporter [Nitrospirae bacterium CG06_land_8_20_14_3_00_70_43]PIW82003.1 MAG: cation transporter [Nitrospirae bacterium CG_4_8_14_3_um_filter_70_85]PIX84449.1 MAG: cation transporter [Nitrospirae bacterium CG_4_10_14_3_um_filter_70_108]
MHNHPMDEWQHGHDFHFDDGGHGERSTQRVVLLTVAMMVVEIGAGQAFGSMALLADGWHMGTHAAALGITAFAYRYARQHAADPRYSFGTGKVGVLGGFASAVALAIVALLMAAESVQRLITPLTIRFNEAIAVAVVGLAVNLVSALLLQGRHDHDHAHAAGHRHDHDHNLRAAYLHVLADGLTSVLAIAALALGKLLGWVWMDAFSGIVGSIVITRWSLQLLRDTSKILLDSDVPSPLVAGVRGAIEADADNRIADLHVWRVSANHAAAVISVVTDHPKAPAHYKELLARFAELAHITVEVNPCRGDKPPLPTGAGAEAALLFPHLSRG